MRHQVVEAGTEGSGSPVGSFHPTADCWMLGAKCSLRGHGWPHPGQCPVWSPEQRKGRGPRLEPPAARSAPGQYLE